MRSLAPERPVNHRSHSGQSPWPLSPDDRFKSGSFMTGPAEVITLAAIVASAGTWMT